MPSFFAASSLPWPAMMPFSPSTGIGFVEPKLLDAGSDLRDLLIRVCSGVSRIRIRSDTSAFYTRKFILCHHCPGNNAMRPCRDD